MPCTDDPPRTRPPVESDFDSRVPASRTAGTPGRVVSTGLLGEDSFLAILSSNQRAGRWEPAEEIEVRAIMGEVTLDFTLAELPRCEVIDIDAFAFCGAIHIIVPDDAEVEIEGTPIVGSIEQTARGGGPRDAARELISGERGEDLAAPPCFRIDCQAIFSSIKVSAG
jgi:hypothetical protein